MTSKSDIDITEFYWLMDILQTIDVGLIVLDREYRIQIWNSFMENHSSLRSTHVQNKIIFDLLSEIPEDWFRHKVESVFLLKNRAFTTWEQRPYVFKFKNYQPITGTEEYMYQNITIMPLVSLDGDIKHICIIIYDVTNTAVNKKGMESANAQLQHLSRTDHLTQLNNRGYWEECLAKEYMRYQRIQNEISLVMFDIDHFKKVNDTHGHQAGDEVICVTAEIVRKTLRKTDIAGRYGGEEFAILLIGTDAEKGLIFCERLRNNIDATTVRHQNTDIKFTVSLGLAELTSDINNYKEWLEQSDQALYESKKNGRNRTTIFKTK